MPLYDLPIWAGDPMRFPQPGIRGAGFRFFTDEMPYMKMGTKPWERHFGEMRKEISRYSVKGILSGGEHWTAPRVSIEARSRIAGQRAFDLLVAALDVLEGHDSTRLRYKTVVPRDRQKLEDLIPLDLFGHEYNEDRPNVILGCRFAAALSRKKAMTYAAFKLQVSYSLASTHWMSLHPQRYPKYYAVSDDPIEHVRMASAVTLAYSAIEEMQLEPRPIGGRQIKTESGWDQAAHDNLLARLQMAGTDAATPIVWSRRGSPTRIHNSKRAAIGSKQPWSKGIVRDTAVAIEDALIEASWLRSKCTTHKYQKATSSISMYDVANVQTLSRRLLLESCGLWKTLLAQ
jgi:hypothetical protein